MRTTIPLLSILAAVALASGPGLAQDEPAAEGATTEATAAEDVTAEAAPASGQEENVNVGVTSVDIIPATSTNVLGEPITFPTGTPELASWIATFEKGGRSSRHQHPVPMYVYVLEGELEVRPESGEPYRIAEGEAIIEPQDTTVQAFNVADGPTKILVVAMAAQGQPSGVNVDE
jgi:quercetin dioxygenase-like cupin family protein